MSDEQEGASTAKVGLASSADIGTSLRLEEGSRGSLRAVRSLWASGVTPPSPRQPDC